MIPLKRPEFWRDMNVVSILLYPISQMVNMCAILKKLCIKKKQLNAVVICVGNITVGGAGKTPLAIYLGQKLKKNGFEIAYVSRGFGGVLSNKRKAERVKADHSAIQVGDEALLLAEVAPTYICINRYLAASEAVQGGAQIVIMDDGMQHRSLHKDITVLTIDADYGFGNGLMLPAGPLRQSISSGMAQADFMACIGDSEVQELKSSAKPCFRLRYHVPSAIADKLMGKRVVLMCSIASPDKFIQSVKGVGAVVDAIHSFPDHHNYTEKELMDVLQQANGLQVVITSKDMVKIPESLRNEFLVLEITVSDKDNLCEAILGKLTTLKTK